MIAENAPDPDQSDSKLRLRLWLTLLKSTRHLENDLRNRLRQEFNTTLPRFDVMATLQKSGGGLKMSQLSSQLMVSNGNVTGIVDRLVADGLVVRVSIKDDRRATLVQLTPKGEDVFSELAETHEGWVSDLLADLGDAEIEAAMTMLSRIRN